MRGLGSYPDARGTLIVLEFLEKGELLQPFLQLASPFSRVGGTRIIRNNVCHGAMMLESLLS